MLGLEASQAEKDTALSECLCSQRRLAAKKPKLTLGAVRVACNGLCSAAGFHAMKLTACGTTTVALFYSIILILSGLAPASAFLPRLFSTTFSKLLCLCHRLQRATAFPNFAVRSDRLCILVFGLCDTFVTVSNLRRKNRGSDLNFKELVYGGIKMMTAQCRAWAHTYQSMCLNFSADKFQPTAFRL